MFENFGIKKYIYGMRYELGIINNLLTNICIPNNIEGKKGNLIFIIPQNSRTQNL